MLRSHDERALGGNVAIAVFDLRNVESADADAYLEHRLPQFRDPERQEILDLSPVFPFPCGLAGRCVKRDGPSAAPIVLRQMNAHFRKVLADHAMALSGQPEPISMETVSAADLPRYLISEDALMLTSGK